MALENIHTYNDINCIESFVNDGYFIGKNFFCENLVAKAYTFTDDLYKELKEDFRKKHPHKTIPYVGISAHIAKEIHRQPFYEELITTNELLSLLEKILGPDISMLNIFGFLINDPEDTSTVFNKSLHQEVWTGATTDDLYIWLPLADTEPESTLNVIPKSHYFGLVPNMNRKPILPDNVALDKPENVNIKRGDALIFHSLLLHETAGRGKNVRYALQLCYRNTFWPLSNKLKSTVGTISLKVGPMSQVRNLLGNEFLSPFRTYGGSTSHEEY